jgi:hypothetical protein
MEPTSNGIKTWQWVVTAIVIIALIVVGIMVFSKKGTVTTEPVTETPVPENTSASNRIVMTDQYPGNVVYASSVQLANPGFVVIQKDANGKPGAVIGSAYAKAGVTPVKVTLTQPMVDGGLYYASLYSDNGDMKFDAKTDTVITGVDSKAIMKPFRASASVNAEIKG